MKSININDTVYNLCDKNPEVVEILAKIGFKEITNPVMRNTAGRFMTLKKGAEHKKIDLEIIKKEFSNNGFEIID